MRKFVISCLSLAMFSATPVAMAQQAPPAQVTLTAQSNVDDVLQALYARGQNLQDFTADVKLTDTDAQLGSEKTYLGLVRYQRLANGDTRIRVTFDRKKLGDNPATKYQREYKIEKGELIDQDFDAKLENHRQILKPGQKLNPIKLGEGPFPLPIGQEPSEVKKQFDVKLVPPAKDDPPHAVHVKLVPKAGTRLANKFTDIDVWVDMQTNFMPRIDTTDKNGTVIHSTELTNLKINTGLKDGDFQLAPPAKDWGVRTEDLGE